MYAITIDEIKFSDEYIFGEGLHNNLQIADRNAIRHLSDQFLVLMESSSAYTIENEKAYTDEYIQSIFETYLFTMRDQMLYIQEEKDGEYHILRYLRRDELRNIYAQREEMIHDFVKRAIVAEADLRIGDAIKYNYWALCLLKTHPDMGMIKGKEVHMKRLLLEILPEKINNIMNAIEIRIKINDYNKVDLHRTVLFEFTYKDRPITNLDYKYYTGNHWNRSLTRVNNGLGVVEYFGENAKNIRKVLLNIEYKYKFKSNIDVALNNVITSTDIPNIFVSQKKLSLCCTPKAPCKIKINKNVLTEHLKVIEKEKKYFETVIKFVSAYETQDIEILKSCLSSEGEIAVEKLLHLGEAELIRERKIDLICYKLNDIYIIHSIPFLFKSPHFPYQSIEDVVFILNEDKKICALNIALSDIVLDEIMSHSETWGNLEHKKQVIHFIESYRTAYYLQNIDYLERIFLFTHNQIQDHNKLYFINKKKYDKEFVEFSIRDYLNRLRSLFSTSGLSIIEFEEIEIKRMARNNDYCYGIQITQNLFTANYIDYAYQFFMIDINNAKEPKIKFSTQQFKIVPYPQLLNVYSY